jgi:hypothetical protein
MAIGLTLKIRDLEVAGVGGPWWSCSMFFLVVSCVFFGVQWQLVVESPPLVTGFQI